MSYLRVNIHNVLHCGVSVSFSFFKAVVVDRFKQICSTLASGLRCAILEPVKFSPSFISD